MLGDETYVFDIMDLTSRDPTAVSVSSLVGEYYGGVGVSTSRVFVTGTLGTASLPKADLSVGSASFEPLLKYSIVTNLANQQLYALATSEGEYMVTSGEVSGSWLPSLWMPS